MMFRDHSFDRSLYFCQEKTGYEKIASLKGTNYNKAIYFKSNHSE